MSNEPEPELPLASTHDVNLLEVTHGMVPTVEPERAPVFGGDLRRAEDETDEEFSLRVAVFRRKQLEQEKGLKERTFFVEDMHPLQKFARVWGK